MGDDGVAKLPRSDRRNLRAMPTPASGLSSVSSSLLLRSPSLLDSWLPPLSLQWRHANSEWTGGTDRFLETRGSCPFLQAVGGRGSWAAGAGP